MVGSGNGASKWAEMLIGHVWGGSSGGDDLLVYSLTSFFRCLQLPANMSGAEKREKMVVCEAAISSSLSHPNIVQTYTYSIKPIRGTSQTFQDLELQNLGSAVKFSK